MCNFMYHNKINSLCILLQYPIGGLCLSSICLPLLDTISLFSVEKSLLPHTQVIWFGGKGQGWYVTNPGQTE